MKNKTNFYIIPGYGHSPKARPYKEIAKCATRKGFCASVLEIDWNCPLSQQKISLKKNDTILGFSLGAVLARYSYGKTVCKKLILCSETPLYRISKKEILEVTLNNASFAEDLYNLKSVISKIKIPSKHCFRLSGEQEKLRGKKIPNTKHELNRDYIKVICQII